jgi:hypothetical protein
MSAAQQILVRLAARERVAVRAQIQSRRDALAAQQQQAEQIVGELEQQLAYGRQQLLAMAGGLQELDDLLHTLDAPTAQA